MLLQLFILASSLNGLLGLEVKSDFFASPKFSVEFMPEPVKDTPEQQALLASEGSESQVLRLPGSDKKYICKIPTAPQLNVEESGHTVQAETGNVTASVDVALKALEKWKSKCLLMVAGWWMYDFCHMSHVRQYHQSQFNGPTEVEFFLGQFIAEDAIKSARIEGGDNEKYLSMQIQDGTLCDVTGNPREAEVHYICPATDREVTRLAEIKEVGTCKYLITVYTSDLCQIPGFSKPRITSAEKINCTLLLNDEQWKFHLEMLEQEKIIEVKAKAFREKQQSQSQQKPALPNKPAAKPSMDALSKILENLLESNMENLIQIVETEVEPVPNQQANKPEKEQSQTKKRQQPTVIIRDEL